ncbi:MAG: WG repeat-containing protein [Thermonemataceae bacterium]
MIIPILIGTHYAVAQSDILLASRDVSGLYGYVNATNKRYVIKPQFDLALPFSLNGIAKVVVEGKWGLIDAKGKTLVKPQYDYIGWSNEEFYEKYAQKNKEALSGAVFYDSYDKLIPYKRQGKWGLLNVKGKVEVSPRYTAIHYPKNKVAIVAKRQGDREVYGLINSKGQVLVKPQYQDLDANNAYTQFIVAKESKHTASDVYTNFGVITAQGVVVIPVDYRALRNYDNYYVVQDSTYQWQIFDEQGERFFTGAFDAIKAIQYDLAIVKKKGKWGVVNKWGKTLIDFRYQEIYQKSFHQFAVLPFTRWKLINANNEVMEEYQFEDLTPISTQLFRFQENGKYGVINHKGEVLKEATYEAFYPFKYGLAVVKQQGKFTVVNEALTPVISSFDSTYVDSLGFIKVKRIKQGTPKWGLYNNDSKLVIPIEYQAVRVLATDLFAVKKEDAWGYMDARSLWVISPQYEAVTVFSKGLAIVKHKGKVGIINREGKWRVEPVFDQLQLLSRHLAVFQSSTRKGLLDIDRKKIKVIAETLQFLPNGLIKTKNKSYWGLYNIYGDELIPDEYISISDCTQDSVFTAYKNGNYSLFNQKGKALIRDITYREMGVMSEGLVAVRANRTWGYINERRRHRISSRYAGAKPFHEGLAAIKMGKYWGYINKGEVLVIKPSYSYAHAFKNGHALVKKRGKWGFIDKYNRVKVEIRYDDIKPLPSGRWLTYLGTSVGLINQDLKEVIRPKYDLIKDIDKQHVLVQRRGKWGLSDFGGADKIPAIYDYLFVSPYNDLYLTGQKQHWLTIEVKE